MRMKEFFGAAEKKLNIEMNVQQDALLKMVPEAGLEPAQPYGQQILSLSCLPIPPLGLIFDVCNMIIVFVMIVFLGLANDQRMKFCEPSCCS